VRGLMNSLRDNFGFEPQNAMLMDTDLNMAGYRGDAVPAMQAHDRCYADDSCYSAPLQVIENSCRLIRDV